MTMKYPFSCSTCQCNISFFSTNWRQLQYMIPYTKLDLIAQLFHSSNVGCPYASPFQNFGWSWRTNIQNKQFCMLICPAYQFPVILGTAVERLRPLWIILSGESSCIFFLCKLEGNCHFVSPDSRNRTVRVNGDQFWSSQRYSRVWSVRYMLYRFNQGLSRKHFGIRCLWQQLGEQNIVVLYY